MPRRRCDPRQAVVSALFSAVIALMLASCAAQAPRPVERPPIWDVAAQRFVTKAELVTRLAAARYRLLGEIHDDPAHHAIRGGLIRDLAATGKRPAVVFEQFDLDRDAALIAAQQRPRNDAEVIVTAGGLDRKGWEWPLHKPIVDAALAANLPIRAGNMPRAELMRAARTPDTHLDAKWAARFAAASWTPAQDAELRADIVDGHCGKLPEQAIAGIARAQRMRDAAMAQALVDAATSDGAILIAGDGHVRRDLAVPVYLPSADGATVSLGFIEATAEDWAEPDFPDAFRLAPPGFDFVWFTATVRRKDPCEQMPAAASGTTTVPAAPSARTQMPAPGSGTR